MGNRTNNPNGRGPMYLNKERERERAIGLLSMKVQPWRQFLQVMLVVVVVCCPGEELCLCGPCSSFGKPFLLLLSQALICVFRVFVVNVVVAVVSSSNRCSPVDVQSVRWSWAFPARHESCFGSYKELVVTGATLVVTGALLVVTRS